MSHSHHYDDMNIKLEFIISFLLIKQLTEQARSEDSNSDLYKNFDPSKLSESEFDLWVTGKPCSRVLNGTTDNRTIDDVTIYCPMPFEAKSFRSCCGEVQNQYCCETQDKTAVYIGIGIGATLAGIVVIVCVMCFFNKCTGICVRKKPETAPPRPKLKLQANAREIRPIDKRTVLKTANYTVEKSWDQLHVKFVNEEFFKQFTRALLDRYQDASWKDVGQDKEGLFTCSSGEQVALRMLCDARILIVSREGNNAWVMNDFQNICKNLAVQEWPERQSAMKSHTTQRPLQPRLPTIGEEYHEATDFSTKISQTETEVKFASEELFQNFKRVLLLKHPELTWSKYLQRDCAQIRLSSGKAVTLHLWEDVRTVWMSGDGKKEWYQNGFQDLVSDATSKSAMEALFRPGYHSDTGSLYSRSSVTSRREAPNVYTVKTLDTGGFEIEFPSMDFLTQLKDLLQMSHPSITWESYSSRDVTKIALSKNRTVSVHLSTPGSRTRKLWIYDEPGNRDWFNTEFKGLYALAYDNIYRHNEVPHSGASPMTPVESAL